jgi:hypothetical protein
VNHPGNCLPVGDILLRLSLSGLRFRKQASSLRDHRTALPRFFLSSVGFRFRGRLFSNAVSRELRCRKFSLCLQLSQYAVSFLGLRPRLGLWSQASAMGVLRCLGSVPSGGRDPAPPFIPLHRACEGATAPYCSVLGSRLKRKCWPGPWLDDAMFCCNPLKRAAKVLCFIDLPVSATRNSRQ